MKEFSFDDTIAKTVNVIELIQPTLRVFVFSFIAIYSRIDDYEQSIIDEEAKTNTKYKNVNWKGMLIIIPFPRDRWWQTKEIVIAPSRHDPRHIGYTFIKETWGNFQIGGADLFLLKHEKMLKELMTWKSFCLLFEIN